MSHNASEAEVNQAANIIQSWYREKKREELRWMIEPLFFGKKERNRLSMCSVRKYYGDYLFGDKSVNRGLLTNTLPFAPSETVLFSGKSRLVIKRSRFSGVDISPRFLVLTTRKLYLVALVKFRNMREYRLDFKVDTYLITSCSLSTFADNFVVFHCGNENQDIAVEVEYKTELIAWLKSEGHLNEINFANE